MLRIINVCRVARLRASLRNQNLDKLPGENSKLRLLFLPLRSLSFVPPPRKYNQQYFRFHGKNEKKTKPKKRKRRLGTTGNKCVHKAACIRTRRAELWVSALDDREGAVVGSSLGTLVLNLRFLFGPRRRVVDPEIHANTRPWSCSDIARAPCAFFLSAGSRYTLVARVGVDAFQ